MKIYENVGYGIGLGGLATVGRLVVTLGACCLRICDDHEGHDRHRHMDLTVDGLIFDLDNTLFDFESAFAGVARNFYEQHLRTTTSTTRADAVAMMIRWDDDLHAVTQYVPDLKARRFARWLSEWPDTGLDIASLTGWYDDAMDQQMRPDPEVNRFLAHLIDRKVPWGIVTNGPSRMQRHKCIDGMGWQLRVTCA